MNLGLENQEHLGKHINVPYVLTDFYDFFQMTHVNLNNMLCPAVSDPFEGKYYRLWALGHQHVLIILHGKFYQITAYAVQNLSKLMICCLNTVKCWLTHCDSSLVPLPVKKSD